MPQAFESRLRGQLAPAAGFSSSAPTRRSAQRPYVRGCPSVSARSHRSSNSTVPRLCAVRRESITHITRHRRPDVDTCDGTREKTRADSLTHRASRHSHDREAMRAQQFLVLLRAHRCFRYGVRNGCDRGAAKRAAPSLVARSQNDHRRAQVGHDINGTLQDREAGVLVRRAGTLVAVARPKT